MPRGDLTDLRLPRASRSETGGYPWRIFWVLSWAAVFGYLAVLPYLFQMFRKTLGVADLPMPVPVFVVVQLMQAMILFGLVVGLGLILAQKVGLPMPLLRFWLYRAGDPNAGRFLRNSLLIGFATGLFVVAVFVVAFLRYLPAWPSEAGVPVWKRLLACFYGGFDEELLLRLFLLAFVLWLVQVATRREVRRGPVAFWFANILVAVIFAAAHLPAAKALMPLTPVVIAAVMTMNGLAGLVFGYLSWNRGIEAAIAAHFASDLVLHFVGPLFTST